MRIINFTLLFLCLGVAAQASHIIGGEIHYDYLGNDNYKISVRIYRDCAGIGFDDPLPLTLFNGNGDVITTYYLASPVIVNVPPPPNNPCLIVPPNICVEEALYELTLNLPPQDGGYTLSYQRCCRNSSVANINLNQSPGATFTTFIPGPPHWGNTNPLYDLFPPTIICANFPLEFDHSATDADGDSLVYSLCESFVGAGPDTIPGPDNCPTCQAPDPATPPAYSSAVYVPPFSPSNPMGGNPPLSIDPETGMLTGTPTTIGQFVVAVCVSEYRDGVLISQHRRDFQFNVAECVQSVQAFAATDYIGCNDFEVAFNDSSTGGFDYLWHFGSGEADDTTNQHDPTFTYPEGGEFTAFFVVNPGTLCSDTAFVPLNIWDTNDHTISSDTTIYLGTSASLKAGDGIGYTWLPDSTLSAGDVSDPLASPTVTTTYTVAILLDSGCVAYDSVVVNVNYDPYIVFPNAFTPNSDGVNDLFRPFVLGFVDVEIFRIYNRWGQLVYDGKSTDGWNGKYNGVEQDIGTFAYYFKGKSTYSAKMVEYQGNFTLIR